jgi:DNA-binding response OmpR family regulator
MKNDNKKILLVEDDPNFGSILKEYLTLNDYDITLAKNGIEGFEKFRKDHFDLCILDVMMPYKDGFTLAREIREEKRGSTYLFPDRKAPERRCFKRI